jgi:hypothetical protein
MLALIRMLNQGCASLKQLWFHCRNINVEVFQNKIVYNIPVYGETIFKLFKYNVEFLEKSSTLRITLSKPTESLSKKLLN